MTQLISYAKWYQLFVTKLTTKDGLECINDYIYMHKISSEKPVVIHINEEWYVYKNYHIKNIIENILTIVPFINSEPDTNQIIIDQAYLFEDIIKNTILVNKLDPSKTCKGLLFN